MSAMKRINVVIFGQKSFLKLLQVNLKLHVSMKKCLKNKKELGRQKIAELYDSWDFDC